MIVDSSAIIAVFLREPDYLTIRGKMESASTRGIGAPTLAETGLVLTSRIRKNAGVLLRRFLREFEIEVLPFTEAHWRHAIDAFDRFGKGRHTAALNSGDCLTYATAKQAGHPLLCTGDDFSQTDLEIA